MPVGAAVAVVAVAQEVVLAEVQLAHAFYAVFVVSHGRVDALVVFVAVDAWDLGRLLGGWWCWRGWG